MSKRQWAMSASRGYITPEEETQVWLPHSTSDNAGFKSLLPMTSWCLCLPLGMVALLLLLLLLYHHHHYCYYYYLPFCFYFQYREAEAAASTVLQPSEHGGRNVSGSSHRDRQDRVITSPFTNGYESVGQQDRPVIARGMYGHEEGARNAPSSHVGSPPPPPPPPGVTFALISALSQAGVNTVIRRMKEEDTAIMTLYAFVRWWHQ